MKEDRRPECQRLSANSMREERAAAHREKMIAKRRERRSMPREARLAHVYANLSRRHPEAALTPREHERRKRERLGL